MFPFPLIFILFVITLGILSYLRRKAEKAEAEKAEAFWSREREANMTHRQDLTQLDYIAIPERLLTAPSDTDKETASCYERLRSLAGQDIVNFSGRTNTDLKLAYGTANLPLLTEMGDRYDTMLITLTTLSRKLMEQDRDREAMDALSFAVQCGSDINQQYVMLASLYKKHGLEAELSKLRSSIGLLPEGKKQRLLTKLDEL